MPICTGTKRDGSKCKYNAKYGDFCGYHRGSVAAETCNECPICYDYINATTKKVMSCGHEFHTKCVNKWLERCPTCPMCRAPAFDTPPNLDTIRVMLDEMISDPRSMLEYINHLVDNTHIMTPHTPERDAMVELISSYLSFVRCALCPHLVD